MVLGDIRSLVLQRGRRKGAGDGIDKTQRSMELRGTVFANAPQNCSIVEDGEESNLLWN